jgi:hypothetical protein
MGTVGPEAAEITSKPLAEVGLADKADSHPR